MPSRHINLTSANIAPCLWIRHALPQPLDGGTLGLQLPPSTVALDLCRDLVALLTLQTRPLCMQPRRAARHPFLPFHCFTWPCVHNWMKLKAIHLAPQRPQSACEQRQAYRWRGLSRNVERLRGLVRERRGVCRVFGAASMAKWFRLPCVRRSRPAWTYVSGATGLPILPLPVQRHRGDDLRQDAYTASCLVRGRLVHHQPEARRQRSGSAACAGIDQL